ncbi:MAG TPA: hypothetical protein V6C52_05225 [Coleofasciculaceae cyanobacterium]
MPSNLQFGAKIQFDQSIIKAKVYTRDEGVTSVAHLVNRALAKVQPDGLQGQPSARTLIEAAGNNDTDTVALSIRDEPYKKNFYTVEARYKRNQQTAKTTSWHGAWNHANVVRTMLPLEPLRRSSLIPNIQTWVNDVALAAQRFKKSD